MNNQKKPSHKTNGVKKNAGHYANAVIAQERDDNLRHPENSKDPGSQDLGAGERISDGHHETYKGNTASELARETGDGKSAKNK